MIPQVDIAELEASVGHSLDDAAKVRVGALYDERGAYIGSASERKVIAFMTARDKGGYGRSIKSAQETYHDIKEHSRADSPTAERTLAEINVLIKETFRAATDRYEDWASD